MFVNKTVIKKILHIADTFRKSPPFIYIFLSNLAKYSVYEMKMNELGERKLFMDNPLKDPKIFKNICVTIETIKHSL